MDSLRQRVYRLIPPFLLLRGLHLSRRIRGRLERETLAIAPFVKPGTVAIDVGAYDGLYTFEFARHGVKKTHAFEPHPVAARRLERGRLPRTTVHPVALSDTSGVTDLVVPSGKYGRAESHLVTSGKPNSDGELTRYKVQTRRLDDYEFLDVSFMKIDVEGHELTVLNGATETLERSRPTMLIEVEQRHHQRPLNEVLAAIEGLGYRGRFLDPSKLTWRALTEFDPVVYQTVPTDRSPTVHDFYIYNFLFQSA